MKICLCVVASFEFTCGLSMTSGLYYSTVCASFLTDAKVRVDPIHVTI